MIQTAHMIITLVFCIYSPRFKSCMQPYNALVRSPLDQKTVGSITSSFTMLVNQYWFAIALLSGEDGTLMYETWVLNQFYPHKSDSRVASI